MTLGGARALTGSSAPPYTGGSLGPLAFAGGDIGGIAQLVRAAES
jgi:hypothetical protein